MLLHVVSGDAENMHEQLLQAQLWREKHRATLTPDKKILDVKNQSHKYLQTALKQIIKMP